MENTPNLPAALSSLSLPAVKFDETGSVKITDLYFLQQADITQGEDLNAANNELLSALRDPASMAADVVKYLEDLRGNGFNACSPKNKHKIPVEIPTGTIDAANITPQPESLVDDTVALTANYVINSFQDNEERNPFAVFEPGSPAFKEAIEKAEYKGVFIRNLSAQTQQEPNRSHKAQIQSNYRSRLYKLQILQMYRWFCPLQPRAATKPVLKILGDSQFVIRRDVLEALRQPIIAIKEGMNADSTVEVNKLAVEAFPHLVSFLLLHLKGEPFDKRKHTKPLPKDLLILGMLYDDTRATIYAHFAYFGVAEQRWRLCQVKMAELEYATFEKTMTLERGCKHAELAIAAHIVREHGRRLYERFTSEEYGNLVEKPTNTDVPKIEVAETNNTL
ncbi:hypothetical protein EIP86_007288 [Pleurotus ostreatoroseus]|nr:hypothetical protein EIP86_007288 [Pleurotus ostreatoroseus]